MMTSQVDTTTSPRIDFGPSSTNVCQWREHLLRQSTGSTPTVRTMQGLLRQVQSYSENYL
jgi:hypothetical protein